jgi:hypothetical protein
MTEYKLPDGQVLSVKDNISPEDLQKLRTQLVEWYPNHYQPYKEKETEEEADLSYSDKAIYGLKGLAQTPEAIARGALNTALTANIGLSSGYDLAKTFITGRDTTLPKSDDGKLTAELKNIKGYINADPSADSAAANISQAKLLSKIDPKFGGISLITDYLKGKAGINESLLAPNEEYRDSNFNKFPEGLGSGLAFMTTAATSPWTGLLLGGASYVGEQEEMIERAREKGIKVTPTQELGVKGLSFVGGLSESLVPQLAVKMLRGFGKSDSRNLPFIQQIKDVLKKSAQGAAFEGVQETLAGIYQNAIAKGIYDPTIDIYDSWVDDLTVGAFVGGVLVGGSRTAYYKMQQNQGLEYETNQAKNYDEEQKASDEIIRQKIILAAEQGDQVIDPALVPDAPIDLINNIENELNNINNELNRLDSDETFDAYDLITNEEEKRNKVIEDKEKAKELKIRKEASESALKFITKGAGKNVVWTEQQIKELIAAEIELAKSIPGKIVFDKLNTKEKELILQQAKINRERLFKAQNIADNYNPYNQLDDKVKPEGVEIPVLETFNFVPNADGTINVVGQETKQTIGTFSNIEEASQAATEKTKQNRNEFIIGFSEQVTSINGLAGNGTASNIGRKLYDPLNNLIDAKVLANFDVRVSDKRQAQAQKEKLIEENEQAGQSKLASELMDNMDTTGLSIEELSQIKQDLEIQLSKQQAVYPISGNKIDPESTLALFWEFAEKSGIGAKNFYTVKEAKKLLNKSDFNQFMSEKSNIKFEKIKSTGEMKPVKRIKDKIDVSQKAFDNAFESKNIEVSYTSPAFKYLAETFTGDTNLSNMSIGQKEMLMARIKNLPRFNNKTKLPNFTPRPYTAEQIDAFYNQYQGNRFSNNDIKLAIKNNTNGKDLTPKQINEFKTDLIESGRATKDNNKLSMTNDFKIQQARKAESYSNETTDEFKSRLVRTTLLTPEQIEEVVNDDAIYKEGVIDSSDVLALPSPEPMQKYSELFKLMRKRLIDRNLGDVALKFDRELKASLNIKQKGNKYFYEPVDLDKSKGKPTAVYDRPLNKIILSIEAINPDGTMSEAELGEELRNKLDHESVHALIQLGILTQKEVDMLFKDAKKLLPKDFQKKLINAYTGKPINEINDAYLKKDFSEDLKEELVAEFIRISGNNPSQLISPKSKTIINKIINFLTTLGQTIYDAGFTSSRTIIRDIESGKIGARERGVLRNTQRVRSRNEQKYGIARPSAEQLDTSLISKYKDVPNFSRLKMINEQPLFSRAPTLNTTSLLDFIKQNPEGFTVDPITLKSPSSGFAVAPVKALEIVVDKNKINDDVIKSYTAILKSLSGKMNRDVYAGGWFNSKNSRYYLDASVIFDTLEEALYVAEAAQQKAVYDLGTFNETRTKQGIQELKKTGRFNNQTRNEHRANIQELSKLFRETRNRSSQNQIDTPLFSRAATDTSPAYADFFEIFEDYSRGMETNDHFNALLDTSEISWQERSEYRDGNTSNYFARYIKAKEESAESGQLVDFTGRDDIVLELETREKYNLETFPRVFVMRMPINDFIKLTTPDDLFIEEQITPYIKDNKFDPLEFGYSGDTPFSFPVLAIDSKGQVTGHDGRGRSLTALQDGATEVPVILFIERGKDDNLQENYKFMGNQIDDFTPMTLGIGALFPQKYQGINNRPETFGKTQFRKDYFFDLSRKDYDIAPLNPLYNITGRDTQNRRKNQMEANKQTVNMINPPIDSSQDTPLFSRENPEEIYNEWRSKTYNPKTLEQTEEELKEYVDSLPPSIMPRWNKDAHPISLRVAFDFQEGIDPVIMTDAPSYSRSDKEIPNKYKEIDEAINGTNNTPDETFADAIIDIAETKEEVGSFLSRMRAEIIDDLSIAEKTVLKLGKASAKIRELNSRAITGAIQALRMSKKGKGVHSQMMMRGVPVLVDEQGNPVPKGSKNFGGTKVIDFKHGGFVKIIGQLHTTEYGEDLMRLFKMYRIGLRGTRLNKEGKEVVLTPEQLELATEIGKDFPIIQIVSDQYSEYNNAILDYAVQTGILSEEITINQLIENISSNQKVKITKNDLTNLAKEARKNELTDEQFRQELLILSSDLNIKLEADNKIETRGTAEIWKDNADYYPFYRKMADDSIQGPAVAGGFLSGNPLNIEIKGSKKAIEPEPLEVMARNMQSIVTAAMKNEGLSRLMAIFEEGRIAKKILLKDKKEAKNLGSDVIAVFENGEKVYYQVADPILTYGLQALGMTQDASTFMKAIGLPANILRESITRDPGFIIKNMLRDTLSSAVTSGANFIPIVDTFKGFAADLSELERFGVIGGYDAANDRQDVVKKINKIKREQGLDVYDEEGNFAIDQVVKLWDFMGGLTTRSDGSTRKAVADSILELTGDQVEAAYQALEIINFDRRGFNPYMRIVTTAIPFLNARIQGLDVLYRSGTGQYSSKISEIAKNTTPDEVAKSIILTTAFRGGMLTLATLLYYALMGDEERYEGERQSVRDDNWLIPTPDGLPPLKFPIPFEVGFIFKTVPERILDYSMTKFNNPNYGNTTGKQLEDSISRGITTTLKLDPTAWQLFKPLKEVRNNKSGFTGNPIVPPFMEEGIEPYQQYTTNTSSFAIALGDQFNVSPIKIDYLMNQYTGTIGTYLLNIADIGVRKATGREYVAPYLTQLPVVKSLFASQMAGGLQEQYYEMRSYSNMVIQTINDMEKKGRIDELIAYTQSHKGALGTRDEILRIERFMKQYRADKLSVQISKLSPKEKREIIKQLDEGRNLRLSIVPLLVKQTDQPSYLTGLMRN